MTTVPVKIPPMGESITSGVLAKWHVAEGATVRRDQPLFELETDKITSEATAEAAGVIRLAVKAGDEVRIGQVVATIEVGATAAAPAPAPAAATPAAPAPAPVSPAVRRVAAETGLDPAKVSGTGKAGRVTKGDLLAAAAASPAAPTPAAPVTSATAPAAPAARQTRRKLSPLPSTRPRC